MTPLAKSPLAESFRGRRILVTGHTGFKGSWLSLWLSRLGAEVIGFSDRELTGPSAYQAFARGAAARDLRGDVRDADAVAAMVAETRPEAILHLAAQPIVRAALADPWTTFATNVMGTAAVLEAARRVPGVRAAVIVTSDKVYRNANEGRPFIESDPLGGHEPYAASKAAAELVAMTYRAAGFHRGAGSANVPAVATARAGNVIGGGDWAAQRLLPDALRAIAAGEALTIRSPEATRPWQHVLEPLGGYLMLLRALLEQPETAPAAVNFGPEPDDAPTVRHVAGRFLAEMAPWSAELIIAPDRSGAEAHLLTVDSGRARETLGWRPAWRSDAAIAAVADWHKAHFVGESDMRALTLAQIDAYCAASAALSA